MLRHEMRARQSPPAAPGGAPPSRFTPPTAELNIEIMTERLNEQLTNRFPSDDNIANIRRRLAQRE
jgi:hypothetical protein